MESPAEAGWTRVPVWAWIENGRRCRSLARRRRASRGGPFSRALAEWSLSVMVTVTVSLPSARMSAARSKSSVAVPLVAVTAIIVEDALMAG